MATAAPTVFVPTMFTLPVDTTPTKENIKKALDRLELERKDRLDSLAAYYLGEHEILERVKVEGYKNNKVIVNHAKYITDINVGYLLGNEIEYQTEDEGTDISVVTKQYQKQNISDVDNVIGKGASKLGRAYEIVYATEENDVHSKFISARNCILIFDDTLEHNILFGITYSGKNEDDYLDVKVYTKTEIQEWDKKLASPVGENAPHNFGDVPLIEYMNTPERIGDYEPVQSLMDAYNTIQSDRVNDREQLVEAILLIYGMTMTPEQKKELREQRMIAVPRGKSDNVKVEYLIKNINEAEADVLREKIEGDIHKISMTPNLSDKNFVGNSSGVAIKYKLIAFEQSIVNKERYFERGLKRRFMLYNNYFAKLNNMKKVETYQIDAIFKRNLPSNDLELSQIISNLDRIVDRETLVGQLSFIDNAKESMEKAAKEAIERAKLLSDEFGDLPDKNQDEE